MGQLTSYSDHKPCVGTLNFNHQLLSGEEILATLEDAPLRYRWKNVNGESEKLFLQAQDHTDVCKRLEELQGTKCESPDEVKELNNQIVNVLKEIADKTLPNKDGPPSNTKKKRSP